MHSQIDYDLHLTIMSRRSPAKLTDALAAPEPLILEEFQAALADASPATTFRYLRQVPHRRSYNHNGRFYTHAEPPRFDRDGLLSYRVRIRLGIADTVMHLGVLPLSVLTRCSECRVRSE